MKRTIATIQVQFNKGNEGYASNDADIFLDELKDFIEDRGKGYAYTMFLLRMKK